MAAILKDMGVQDYEPRCINMMLEFAYRYVTDVLDDSKVYSSHANKKNIDGDDVRLAIQCRMDHSFTTPPPRDLLMEIVRNKNSQPLPLIKPYSGPRLPPDRYCLIAPNYKLKSTKKHKLPLNMPVNQYTTSSLPSQRISLTPLQQNIAGKIGSGIGLSGSNKPTLTVVSKGVSLPTVTIVSKPVSTPTPMTPKPTIRITTGSKHPISTSISSGPSMPLNQPITVTTSSTTMPASVGITTSSSTSSSAMVTGVSQPSLPPPPPPPPPSISQTNTPQTVTSAPPVSGTQTTVNPLKRKHPDDDYDQP